MDQLSKTITEMVVGVFKSGRFGISVCAAHEIECSGWLIVELLKKVNSVSHPIRTVAMEAGPQWIRFSQNLHSVQVHFHSEHIPLEDSVQGLPFQSPETRLTSMLRASGTGGRWTIHLVGWIFYPVPDPEPKQIGLHAAKVEALSQGPIRRARIPLWDRAYAHMQVIEVRPDSL